MNDEERDRIEGECAEAMATTEWTGDVEPVAMDLPTPPDGPVNSPSVLGVEPIDYQAMCEKLKEEVATLLTTKDRLTAHLISKGYGHNAIKRILKGEVVR